MNRIFGPDSPFNRVMSLVWDLIILNLLVILTCIPIITIGASLTALDYCLIQLIRKKDGYMSTMYFKAFKDNFKKATLIWLPLLFFGIMFRTDWVLFDSKIFHYFIAIVAIITVFLFQFVYPLLAHFENTIFNTVKNSFILGVAKFPRTFVMAIIWVIPFEILLRSIALFPLILMLGISLPAYVGARLYEPVFREIEPPSEDESQFEELSFIQEDQS